MTAAQGFPAALQQRALEGEQGVGQPVLSRGAEHLDEPGARGRGEQRVPADPVKDLLGPEPSDQHDEWLSIMSCSLSHCIAQA